MNKIIKKIAFKIPYLKKLYQKINKLSEYEDRIKLLEKEKTNYNIPYFRDAFTIEQQTPYKLKINQPDLADYEQNFYSASQIAHYNINTTPYIPTFKFNGEYINNNHRYYSMCSKNGDVCINTDIEGWLHAADALKIYEITYFSRGDILNLGTFKGLSASVIVQAIKDSNNYYKCDSVDINAKTTKIAKKNIKNKIEEDKIDFFVNDCSFFMDTMMILNRKYYFIFIDAGHGYKNTFSVAVRCSKLLIPGGFVLFHDYVDQRNFDKKSYYGVFQAANDSLLIDKNFIFCGVFGCSALFRYVSD